MIIFLDIGDLSLTTGAARLFCCRAGAKPNVPKTKLQIGEGRRLTATWLNVMAAGIISAGTIPVLTALALEGWGSRARALLLLPCFAFALGLALHLVGRLIVREKTCGWPGLYDDVSVVRRDGSPGDLGSVRDPVRFSRLKTILTPCSRNSETTRARPYGPSFVIWRLSLLIVRLSCGKRLRFDVGLSSRSAFEKPLNCSLLHLELQSCLSPTWLSRFICRICAGKSASICGRPPLVRDFHRQ